LTGYVAHSLGIVAVIVAVIVVAPIAAIWLGRAHPTAPFAFGIAAAVLLWDGHWLSVLILRGGEWFPFRPRAGFWLLLASVATFSYSAPCCKELPPGERHPTVT
jgi:hypothetical protein